MTPLFDHDPLQRSCEQLEEGAVLLRGFATEAPALVEEVKRIAQAAPFRRLVAPGGYTMSVAMTNCGRVGWVSGPHGYRYDPADPDTGAPWPAMPVAFLNLAARAAAEAGFAHYDPDACLINRYIAGAKLGLHQDRDEEDAWAPIVSVSLGVPAVYSCGAAQPLPPRIRVVFQDANHCTALHASNENHRVPSVCDFFLDNPKMSGPAFRACYSSHNKLA
jgi:alkylated DNA repair protein (DNA oxidative demethylase)